MAIYSATATVTGGREGRARTSDGKLDVKLSIPKEMGGDGGSGTNPEQLFAAGYGACFESVMRKIAEVQKKPLTDTSVTAHVNMLPKPGGGFMLGTELEVTLDGLSREEGLALIEAAHQRCPYSNITRGNMDVKITLV